MTSGMLPKNTTSHSVKRKLMLYLADWGMVTTQILASTRMSSSTLFTNTYHNIMLNQILSTCKQLNRLLKTKDAYHADLVSTLLAKIEAQIPSEKQALDKDDIIDALNKKD